MFIYNTTTPLKMVSNNFHMIQVHFHVMQKCPLHNLYTHNNNAPINCLPHYPPLGHWVGMGRDLTIPVINYPTLWSGEGIKSPPMTLVPHRGLCGNLIIQISKYFLFRKSFQRIRSNSPPLGQVLCSKLRNTFPTCSPREDRGANN